MVVSNKYRWTLCKGKYFLCKSVNEIWPLFVEKYFLCIHLFFDSKELIRCPFMKEFSVEEVKNIVKHSNIQLGLLFKKSINGKKAFKKSLGEAFLSEGDNYVSLSNSKVVGSKTESEISKDSHRSVTRSSSSSSSMKRIESNSEQHRSQHHIVEKCKTLVGGVSREMNKG